MGKFTDIEALTAGVEAGSFSAAGDRLGIAKSVVSRRISQLERRLGCRLLHRTTRRLALTDTGKNFYQRAVQILADLDDAEQSVTEETTELRGSLKLAAPLSFGLMHLSDSITEFLGEHPAIELNLDLNDRNINLVEEGYDMAVRIGELQDSTLVARRIGTARNMTCASHAYLDRHGEPAHPDELHQHTYACNTAISVIGSSGTIRRQRARRSMHSLRFVSVPTMAKHWRQPRVPALVLREALPLSSVVTLKKAGWLPFCINTNALQ